MLYYNRLNEKGGDCVPTIAVDGLNIAYIDQGCGPVVLLLHGWGAPAETYRLIIDHLSAYCRVIAPDLPGFGGSDEPPEAWTPARYAAFVGAFAAALDISEAVLMGHSNGGRIALYMLGHGCPFTVKKAVLLDAAGLKPHHGPSYYRKVASYKTAKWFFSLPGVRSLFPNAVENARRRHGSDDYRAASPVMRQSMVLALHEDMTPLLPRIRASVLLIWGECDTATPLGDGRKMARLIPDAGLVTLPGAGHFAFAERWGQCARVLDSFLKDA